VRASFRRSGRRSGFTILEVVLAMGILAIGSTVVLSLLTFGAALSQSAVLSTSSAAAIEAVISDLEETLFPLGPDGTLGEPVPIEDRPVPGVPGVLYSATATANPDHPIEYRVDVDVRWRSGGARRERRFQTILLRELSFGERMRRQFVERGVLPSASSGS
jgi:prepilin-type N-terminal cleavage/methylation domain-containing protein